MLIMTIKGLFWSVEKTLLKVEEGIALQLPKQRNKKPAKERSTCNSSNYLKVLLLPFLKQQVMIDIHTIFSRLIGMEPPTFFFPIRYYFADIVMMPN